MVYGHRPKDWFPLTGGDPCPGDPEAWAPVVGHYEQRVEDLRRLRRDYLLPHTSIDAEGNRFRRLEQVFSDGAQMLEMVAEEFSDAAEVIKWWQNRLREMQESADEALRKAREQQFLIEGYEQKIAALDREADSDPEWDPIIRTKIGFLMGEIGIARALIAVQQVVVDGVRRQYEMIAASVRSQYHIRSVGDMYLHRKLSNPLSDSHEVFTHLIVDDASIDFDAETLNRLADKASESPQDLERFLDELKTLDSGQLAAYFASRPDLVLYPLEVSDETVDNAVVAKNWWAGLSQEKRDMLAHSAMGLVANLEGVAYSARAQAGRRLLDTVLEDPELKASAREKLDHIRKVLDSAEEGTPRYLTSLDLSNLKPENEDGDDDNDVLASMSLGSIDEADKVSVMVPGMGSKATSMENLSLAGTNIYKEQEKALESHGDSGQKHAVEIWIGYETPTKDAGQFIFNTDKRVNQLASATEGGRRLAAHLDGMNVTKSDHSSGGDYSDPSISVIAHSYGTTTMGEATQYAETNVDSIVLYGSAGISHSAVADANGDGWNVDRDSQGRQKIYYTNSNEDRTAWWGEHLGAGRRNPGMINDAQLLQTDEGISADGQYYEDNDDHAWKTDEGSDEQGYVDEKTTSLYYGARVALGYEEDLSKRFYSPEYYLYDGSVSDSSYAGGSYSGNYIDHGKVGPDDLAPGGYVSEEQMEKIRKSQNIPESDLVGGEARD